MTSTDRAQLFNELPIRQIRFFVESPNVSIHPDNDLVFVYLSDSSCGLISTIPPSTLYHATNSLNDPQNRLLIHDHPPSRLFSFIRMCGMVSFLKDSKRW